MQRRTLNTLLPAAVLTLSLGAFAGHAFADCDDNQETAVGKAIAAAAAAKVGAVVPAQGKQMISLDTCDAVGANVVAEFKYNVIAADGLYWASGKAKVAGGAVQDMSFSKLSPNLASASAAKGVKLASN